MKKISKDIKNKILTYEDIPERINALKDTYKGEKCYIIGAGPSLKNYTQDYLKEKLKEELVISLKQSYEVLEEIVDIHILNFANYRTYDYKDNNPIVAWEIYEQFHVPMILENNLKCDLMLPTSGNWESDEIKKFKESQCGSLSFDNWTLDKTLNRQFGPSIIFEMAIPIALHLGVSEIVTLGWDIGDISKFDDIEGKEFFQEHFDNSSEKIVYAKTPQTRLELETIINSTEFLNKWLKDKGVDFKIISDRNPSHESIERVEL